VGWGFQGAGGGFVLGIGLNKVITAEICTLTCCCPPVSAHMYEPCAETIHNLRKSGVYYIYVGTFAKKKKS
jgi:hypothetical protein